MSQPSKFPVRLTVIIRDESPLFINEPVENRRVTIDLTKEQQIALCLKHLGSIGHERVSQCILEF